MSKKSQEPRNYRAGRVSATAGAGIFSTINKADRVAFYDRSIVLSRIFANDPDSWVLKGGTALVWRDTTARSTRDIDLFNSTAEDINDALHALRNSLETISTAPSDVHLVIDSEKIDVTTQGNRQQAALQVHLQSASGMPLSNTPVKIDLVVGCHVTGEVDAHPADGLEKVLQSHVPHIRLYPIVDHLADKVAATMQSYPSSDGDSPSSRVHDLIDIAHIALTEEINGNQLIVAIESERIQRGLPPYKQGFQCPPHWAELYRKRKGSKGSAPQSFDEAVDVAKRLIDSAICGKSLGMTWKDGSWHA